MNRIARQRPGRALMTALLLAAAAATPAMTPAERARLESLERSHQQQLERDRQESERLQAELQRQGDEQQAKLEDLRRRLQQCGNCGERAALQAEIERIEAGRAEALRLFCNSFEQLRALNPAAVDMVAGLAQRGALCKGADRYAPDEAARRSSRQQLEEKARSGKPEDLHRLAMWQLKVEEDVRGGCALLEAGVAKGQAVFMQDYAQRCLGDRRSGVDVQRGERMLRQCADQGQGECQLALRQLDVNREASAQRDAAMAERRAHDDRQRQTGLAVAMKPLEAAAERRRERAAEKLADRQQASQSLQERRERESSRVCAFETQKLEKLAAQIQGQTGARQRHSQQQLERVQRRRDAACTGG